MAAARRCRPRNAAGHQRRRRCRVDPGQRPGLRGAGGKPAEQVAGAASDVEYPHGGWYAGQGQVRRPVGDLVMQLAEPAFVVALRTLAERSDVTIPGHT
jgi:hypothetical protein